MRHNAFSIKNLSVKFDQKVILQIDELDIAAGKIHALLGPSGAGKTTLIRVLNLLQKPSGGDVVLFGQPVSWEGPGKLSAQRTMSMVFQKPALFSGTVYYNVAMGLKIRGVTDQEIKSRVFESLEMVGLSETARRSALTLSGGEAQRIALARALVVKPKVLLLDEPTANLDPANVTALETIIRQVHQQTGTTVILVTHNLYQAKRLCDETIFINKGTVVESGPTKQLFNQPANELTRMFTSGEMIY